ncbi:hypothetical protein LT679_11935 [Mucilaginibacter roseus]|uniref:DUF3828 domain-containing protein n=1 Tax=Mucilaginibacter roseus TaxID=1528868 RepID=A0ABS8U5H6_9SPHI|nr:hypothetical protein [Mucilaginibacter roseus]MCD8741315.1 hypothetical protein [Mucilaginibacter roseus]
MFRTLLLALILATLSAKAQPDTSLLHKAYHQQSRLLLDQFLEKWYQNNLLPDSSKTKQKSVINEVISAFYTKENLVKMDEYEYFQKSYKNTDYLFLPDTISIYSIKQDTNTRYVSKKGESKGVIKNFRTVIPSSNKKVIYLHAEDKKMFDDFLLINLPKGITKENIKYIINERVKRQHFLSLAVALSHSSSWGFNVTPVTYPNFVGVYLNEKSTTAIVEFRSTKGGGAEAIFKKSGNTWVFSSVHPTWME